MSKTDNKGLPDNLQFLSQIFEEWTSKEHLPLMCASDLLHSQPQIELVDYQRAWLRRFIELWDFVNQNDIQL